MPPRRRTLCFVLIFLSLNNELDFVAGLPVGPVITEYFPSPGSPPSISTIASGPGNRVLTEFPQKFPTERFNEVFSFSSYPPGLAINTVATTNYGAIKPNSFNPYSTYYPYDTLNSLPIVESITESLPYPQNLESVTVVENYSPVTQTVQVESFAPTPNVAEIYQTPITVQNSQLSPLITVGLPLPEILPTQNIIQEIYTPNVVPEICPQTIETITSVPVETTCLNIPSCDVGCGGQQLPITLQINLASPWIPESVRPVISQPAPAPSPCPSFDPSFSMPPAPIIVMEKSKSKLKNILPILLLTLLDGGCGNNGGGSGGCSCSSCPTPVPFPIVVPINSPVITCGNNKGKGKPSTDAQS